MGALFSGRFVKVSQEAHDITENGVVTGKWYTVGISNGTDTFEVTAGEKNELCKLPLFKEFLGEFGKKNDKPLYLSCISAVPATREGGAKS